MSCCCKNGGECTVKKENKYMDITAILMAIVSLALAVYTKDLILYLISYGFIGYKIIIKSIKEIAEGEFFDENALMSIATICAFALGDYTEAVMVLLFFRIGEFLQELSLERSRKSITSLMNIRPDYANLRTDGDIKRVAPSEVNVGDYIVIKPGERVPLDCVITEGSSLFDTSALTGESMPLEAGEGTDILSGYVCSNGLITAKVTKPFGQSTVSKILELTENAYKNKAVSEKFITRFAKVYTPTVILLALLVAILPPIVTGQSFHTWIYRALIFLVISCPCALVICIPLSFFSGIGKASRLGILIKGSNYLEALTKLDSIVFDKTGTLTKGKFEVSEINGGEDTLKFAAYAEYNSSHPIARSIVEKYGKEIDISAITKHEEISGYGISAVIFGKTVLAGNEKLMQHSNISFSHVSGTVVHVAIDGTYAGYISIADQVKEDSAKAIKSLSRYKTYMLTGDNESSGMKVLEKLKIDKGYYSLLPHQKTEILKQIKENANGTVAFVGDGINDAPSLATADVGIAMGGIGSDAAIEAADIVIMNDSPAKLSTAVKIAKATYKVVIQNIVFALAVKIIVMALGTMGLASLWWAIFADVGVTLIVILNTMRIAIYKFE